MWFRWRGAVAHLDASAIDRILKAVGKVPDDLDKQSLLVDLESVEAMHRVGVQIRDRHKPVSGRVPVKRRLRLKQTVAAADKLRKLLETFSDEVESRRLRQCHEEVAGLIAYIKAPPKLLTSLGVNETSAFENLVGRGLALVFKSHGFGKPGYTKNPYSGVFESRFVDFAKTALKELGIPGGPVSDRAIADALTSYRRLTGKIK
jgi:hypothetical protein